MVKIYSLDYMEDKLRNETDIGKRAQLRQLLDDMGEIYPDESEMVDDPLKIFITPQQWKSGEIKKKLILGILGRSFTGKTFQALSASHLTKKHIENDFKKMEREKREAFIKSLSTYLGFTPVWVIGTEESTFECLTSKDNEEYFEHANINYIEVLSRGKGTTLLNHLNTYKNFLIALYALSNQTQGTIVVDSMSGILASQHEIVRRVIAKNPSIKKEQGIPTRYWFWRNVEQEGIMFYARITPMNFVFTAKIVDQSKEGKKDIETIRWHQESNLHLSSVVMRNDQIGSEANFKSTIIKCRPNKTLYNKSYKNLTIPSLMYNILLT